MIISHSVNWDKTCLNISNRLSRFAWKKDLVDCLKLHERQIQYKLTGHRLDVEELYIFASLLDCSIEDLLVFDHDDFVEPERVETNKQTEMPLATVFCRFSAFPRVFCCLKTHIYEELHDILGRIGQKNRDPMELIHVICWIETVGCTEGSEHLSRELEIDHVDPLVAVKSKLAP